jgi:hypothetical protein
MNIFDQQAFIFILDTYLYIAHQGIPGGRVGEGEGGEVSNTQDDMN